MERGQGCLNAWSEKDGDVMKLVVTHYDKFPPETIKNYLKSLRVLDADTKVAFITNDYLDVMERLKPYRVDYVLKDEFAGIYPNCISRFFTLRRVIEGMKPEKVIFSDCRDFAFMEEPFQYINDGVVVSEERKTPTGEGTTNYQWAMGISKKVADYLARFPVICAGMVSGTKLLPLLEVFTQIISQIGGGKVGEHIDQPLMSYIVRRRVELGAKWVILPEENRVCQHLGSECFNFKEWMPAMVHGYPIYPELQQEIEKRLE